MGTTINVSGFQGFYNDIKNMDRFSGDRVNTKENDNKICTKYYLTSDFKIGNPEFELLDRYLRTTLLLDTSNPKIFSPVEISVIFTLDKADGKADQFIDFNVLDSMNISTVRENVIKNLLEDRNAEIKLMDRIITDNFKSSTKSAVNELIKLISTDETINEIPREKINLVDDILKKRMEDKKNGIEDKNNINNQFNRIIECFQR